MKTGASHPRVRNAQTVAVTVLVALAALAGLAACSGNGDGEPARSPSAGSGARVVARVDGRPVTQADIDAVLAEARLGGREEDATKARATAIRRVLVRGEAERTGVSPAEAAVEARLAEVRKRIGGQAALAAALAAAGMTPGQLAAAVRYSVLERALQDAKYAALEPTKGAVRAFYRRNRPTLFTRAEKVRLGDITVPAEGLAGKVREEIANGTPFAAAARRYSMDTKTKFDGGQLGWVSSPTLPAEVRDAIAGLSPGDVTKPFRSFARWHLFKLYARRPAVVTPFADVAGVIRAELTRRLRGAALDDWLARAQERATVEVLP